LLLLVACGGDEPARDEDGALQEAGEVRADRVREGDCFLEPEGQPTQFATFDAVPCTEAHDYEVYELAEVPGERYPGEEVVAEAARTACLDAYEPFVGAPFEGSAYSVLPITPTRETWEEDGDREIICALFEEGVEPTGSQRDAAR